MLENRHDEMVFAISFLATRAAATGIAAAAPRTVTPGVASAAPGKAGQGPAAAAPPAAAVGRGAARGSGLVDVGANLLDPMFQGSYRDKPRHPADLPAVLRRAKDAGVSGIMVTAGSLEDASAALALCSEPHEGSPSLTCTVGVHPTNCNEFEARAGPGGAAAHAAELLAVARRAGSLCVAVGELGLDYDRLNFCNRETQLKYFELQLIELAGPLRKPLFLHCRTAEAAADLQVLLRKHRALLPTLPGVVHSFDGAIEDARAFMELGFHIGLNGCSLRTAENLQMVRQLPSNRILLETDAPWCGIKATHAGYEFVKSEWDEVKKPEKWEEGRCVKDRCEPAHIQRVLEVIAGCRGDDIEALAAEIEDSTRCVFFPDAS